MVSLFDFDLCKRVLLHPKETFAKEKKKPSYRQALMQYGFALWVFWTIVALAVLFFDPNTNYSIYSAILTVIVATLLGMVLFFGLFLVQSLVGYEVAVLLGSKTDFKTHFFITSLYATPLALVVIPIAVVGSFVKTTLFSYVGDALGLCYASIAYKEIHGFDTGKMVAWFLVTWFILILALVILGVGLYLAVPGLFPKTV
ncbi:hypothetical protein HY994_05215 [Candidatus Micrarchaeota archaeon]|nr:hypothetical protein [Candidatus Micrarchaeota archaeon]